MIFDDGCWPSRDEMVAYFGRLEEEADMLDRAAEADARLREECLIDRMASIFGKKGESAAKRFCARHIFMMDPEKALAAAVAISWKLFISKVEYLLKEGNFHNAAWCYYKHMPKYANRQELPDYGFEEWLGARPGLDDFISFEPEIAPAFWHFLRERATLPKTKEEENKRRLVRLAAL